MCGVIIAVDPNCAYNCIHESEICRQVKQFDVERDRKINKQQPIFIVCSDLTLHGQGGTIMSIAF